jgi:hypothetical protein
MNILNKIRAYILQCRIAGLQMRIKEVDDQIAKINPKNVSRQYIWQELRRKEGFCMVCGTEPNVDGYRCEKHRAENWLRVRLKKGIDKEPSRSKFERGNKNILQRYMAEKENNNGHAAQPLITLKP